MTPSPDDLLSELLERARAARARAYAPYSGFAVAEFAPDLRIVYAVPGGVAETTLGALLPAAFALRRASGDHA
jgi:cytidine deaminase